MINTRTQTIVLLSLLFLLTACGTVDKKTNKNVEEQEEKVFKLSHVVQENHIWHMIAEKFNDELESLSNGKMSVEIYPAAQLGAEQDMVQQLETGSIEFAFLTNAYMSTREELLNAWFVLFYFQI